MIVVVAAAAVVVVVVVECYCFLINIIVGAPEPWCPALPRAALIFLHFFVPGCWETLTPRS